MTVRRARMLEEAAESRLATRDAGRSGVCLRLGLRAAGRYGVELKVLRLQAWWRGCVARQAVALRTSREAPRAVERASLCSLSSYDCAQPELHDVSWPVAPLLVERWVAEGVDAPLAALELVGACAYRAVWEPVTGLDGAGNFTSVSLMRTGDRPPLVVCVVSTPSLCVHAAAISAAEAAQLEWVLAPLLSARSRGFMGALTPHLQGLGQSFRRRARVRTLAGARPRNRKPQRAQSLESEHVPAPSVPRAVECYSIFTPRGRMAAAPAGVDAGEAELARA